MPYAQDDGNWSQVQEELAQEQLGLEQNQYTRRLPPVL